jgi:hypothetical protein
MGVLGAGGVEIVFLVHATLDGLVLVVGLDFMHAPDNVNIGYSEFRHRPITYLSSLST